MRKTTTRKKPQRTGKTRREREEDDEEEEPLPKRVKAKRSMSASALGKPKGKPKSAVPSIATFAKMTRTEQIGWLSEPAKKQQLYAAHEKEAADG